MARASEPDVYTETLAVFEQLGEPLTTTEVSDVLGVPRRTVYKRLGSLVDRGALQTKKVGAHARVWWLPGVASPERTAGAAAIDEGAFRAVFDEAFDAMILADDAGAWVEVNPAACDLFGRPREALLGESVASFTPPDYDVEAAWAEFLASDLDRGLYPFVRDDGEERLAEFAATPNIRPGIHLSILRDVTEREETAAELARLNHLNTVLRGIEQATTSANSTQGLADDVCRNLLESEYYLYATLCTTTADGTGFDPLAAVGAADIDESLDATGLSPLDATVAGRAVETETVQVRQVPQTTEPANEPLATLIDHGVRSFAAVPLVHHDVVRGVLVIAATHRGAFDQEERAILHELGATVANAVATLDERHDRLADERLVVTLHSEAVLGPLASLPDIDGATVTLDRAIALDEGIVSYYVLRGLPPEPVLAYLATLDLAVEPRLLDQVEGVSWLELRSADSPTATIAGEFGGRVTGATISDGVAEITVEVPPGTNVRALTSAFEQLAPDISLVAQEHHHRRDTPERRLLTVFGQRFTARQQTALELALYAGYFDWPRRTTAEQLAETMALHPSTLHYHLRTAERKLLTALFDVTEASAAAVDEANAADDST
ncbi:bacterio-opsin activator domain-containing protein [Halorarius litoreus]|uniref:bacterio-opsin activator domain-containing protein n=1 Tax=Halorarius litoreus TaxID=2962676 RepID=UPI0020CCE09E|nr:bacterio-opsin activator domain-containing protein [Halorarius litoreus]